MSEVVQSYTVFLRHTDVNGSSSVRQHQCWDKDRFITSQIEAALKEGGKAMVQQITQDQYRKERQK